MKSNDDTRGLTRMASPGARTRVRVLVRARIRVRVMVGVRVRARLSSCTTDAGQD